MRAMRIALCWLMLGAVPTAWAGKLAADYDVARGQGRDVYEAILREAAAKDWRAALAAYEVVYEGGVRGGSRRGVIDDDEYPLTDAQRHALDKNGDGSVTVEEFEEGQLAGFDALDKNGDGFLDASEMKAKR